MKDFSKIKISDFSYHLPDERIAKYPLSKRDYSKLLVWENGKIKNDKFRNISRFLPSGALLVFNNTRVIHARLIFRKESGAKIEIFCLEPVQPEDHQLAFQQTGKVIWKCMVGNAKKWKEGTLKLNIEINGKTVELSAEKISQKKNAFFIGFSWNQPFTFSEIIENSGILPIPPYLNRETEDIDEITYQTIYAKTSGSVAAPTAGLHFTKKVMRKLAEKEIALREITLHVGAGTFQPVKSETIAGHTMHHEKVVIPKSFIEELISNTRKIIAVGTTSVRSLESLYWLGLKLEKNPADSEKMEIGQWEPYENEALITTEKALENIHEYLENTGQQTLQFSTQIIILPGYAFKLIEGMITNFHQPQSTLLLLISAFLGDDWKEVYDFALNNNFRFLSYGDSNLYLK
ncbi:MAG TPA: S-adenosylmethionine:tRNA ribosyltransferase-isomerase [Mariniphaga anaerophila]|uniref:S-adenosylmethionine:tRNA ribosyltransferase-isomerase n=1 Tax=Mariniphaga anaerophila TaxID=1484053 RepID=A0A831LS38_9BACT|nr:S-adenosylmethionine:tRNA ribosyltransferase-isomerase [Mariniphaga anaerophila]